MAHFDPNAAALPDSGIYGLDFAPAEAAVHVLAVPFDATASYRKGAHRGPDAIVRASRQVDLFDAFTGRPYEKGLALLAPDARFEALNREATALADRIIEVGGRVQGVPALEAALARVNAIGAEVNEIVYAATNTILDADKLPALIGGDHSTPFGAIRACAERFADFGVLHFDAHADLRVAYEGFEWSHASIMDNVVRRIPQVRRLLQVGVRDFCEDESNAITNSRGRIVTIFDRDWSRGRFVEHALLGIVRRAIDKLPHNVYVSFDVDGLDPTLCPNTGTPVPGGLTWGEVDLWLEELTRSGRRVVGLDLNEVNPGAAREDEDSWDAMVAARLLYRLIGVALMTRA